MIKIISKNELDEKIRQIKQNELSVQELIDCLDSKQMYIISNTIIQLVKLKINNSLVIAKLQNLTQYMGERYAFAEGIGIGHFAMATLSIFNTSDSLYVYHETLKNLMDIDIERIKKATLILNDLIDNDIKEDKG
ncbi:MULTISPECIES: hypothetical protein [Brevibacillus]|uniref:Uncharacterized protein n=2 Tax=Paenibacillaceae TaxID=186822 RepID=A0A2Z4MDH5_BREBE|nr:MULTISPECIES: hypothetical protein [Brevibacillus]AWX54577.1 hypothetical protein AB432_005780 [Brevibacillus brevis]NRR23888.1 hypothetical protein [Brevibacillus sp. MS2.2]